MFSPLTQLRLAYTGLLAMTLAAHWIDVPVHVHMLTDCILIIHIGCLSALANEPVHLGRTGKHKVVHSEDQEMLSSRDVYKFPFVASAVLFSLYLVYKLVPKEYVNVVLKAYFLVIGVLVLVSALEGFFRVMLPRFLGGPMSQELFRVRVPFVTSATRAQYGTEEDDRIQFTTLTVISFFVAPFIGAWYLQTNQWSSNNVFGIALSIQGIEQMHLGSYLNGAILLCGLFVYDIFWVFGTDVMVTVAKNFDAPIKLLFPRGEERPSLLGLGDIVIPGVFVAMMLRFDKSLWLPAKVEKMQAAMRRGKRQHRVFGNKVNDYAAMPKTFYWTCLASYFAGLATTVWVMYAFQAAQPALLYLVPACLGSVQLPALITGRLKELWAFSEEQVEEKVAEKLEEKLD